MRTLLFALLTTLSLDVGAAKPEVIVFIGMFDPVHEGHLEAAEAALRETRAEKVIFIPWKDHPKKAPLAQATRAALLTLAIRGRAQMEVASATARRLIATKGIEPFLRQLEQHGRKIHLLQGADAFRIRLHHGTVRRQLNKGRSILVIGRAGYVLPHDIPRRVKVIQTPFHEPVSSSRIRRTLREGHRPAGLPERAYLHIVQRGLYGARNSRR